jgi:hypothetical protein
MRDSLALLQDPGFRFAHPGYTPCRGLTRSRPRATSFTHEHNQIGGHDCCGDKGLACLPGANGTTGARRFLAALSNRGHASPSPLADARHAAVEIGRVEVHPLHAYDAYAFQARAAAAVPSHLWRTLRCFGFGFSLQHYRHSSAPHSFKAQCLRALSRNQRRRLRRRRVKRVPRTPMTAIRSRGAVLSRVPALLADARDKPRCVADHTRWVSTHRAIKATSSPDGPPPSARSCAANPGCEFESNG